MDKRVIEFLFVISFMLGLPAYSQVCKEELFNAVRKYEIDSLDMPTNYADRFYSKRSVFKYSIWWDDVFFVDKANNRGAIPIYEYEMWSSLDRRGKMAEMEGITDETRKEKVRDLISRWNISKLVDLFKMGEGWTYYAEYDPMLYVVRVVIRGGEIVSVNGLTLKGYHCESKFIHLNNKY